LVAGSAVAESAAISGSCGMGIGSGESRIRLVGDSDIEFSGDAGDLITDAVSSTTRVIRVTIGPVAHGKAVVVH